MTKFKTLVIAVLLPVILAFYLSFYYPKQLLKLYSANAGKQKTSSYCRPVTPHNVPLSTRSNPRFPIGYNASSILLQNAILLNGDGSLSAPIDILFENGVIKDIDSGINASALINTLVIDAESRYVTPGLVDMHSHMGLDSWPEFKGSGDTNEMSNDPTLPQVRAIDGFDPNDPAIRIINSGGVTSTLVLPGSANLMGGEGYAFKTRIPSSLRGQDMLISFGLDNQWRYLKMACGENPKRVYGSKGIMPESRLGAGWLYRKKFEAAHKLMNEQNAWCSSTPSIPFPQKLELESLVALLRGQVKLNVHCYETYDLEMMIRHSHEFGFNISAFHHALESWQVADLLAENNIGAAIFADHWGYKKEAYGTSVSAASILNSKKVNVAFKSDHPVISSQNLIFEAAKGAHYGLDEKLAIKAVTSIPAKLLGLDWRIGMIKPGYDADIVIWDKYPLDIGAKPLSVFVDGIETFSRPWAPKIPKSKPTTLKKLESCPSNSRLHIINIGKLYSEKGKTYEHTSIVVVDGTIDCIGVTCKDEKASILDAMNGSIIPGLIAGSSHLGLEEIPSESSTSNGYSENEDVENAVKASDGIHLNYEQSLLLQSAYKSGLTHAVAIPRAEGPIKGYSSMILTKGKDNRESIVQDLLGFHVAIGQEAKSNKFPSISKQVGFLRKTLIQAYNESKIANDSLPLVFHAHEANDILYAISIKKQIESELDIHLNAIIVGGAEAHAVASDLSRESIPVILNPSRCMPGPWNQQRCIVPLSSPSSIEKLFHANVSVGLSFTEDNFYRGLVWESGWAIADAPQIPLEDAIGMITWNIAEAYKLKDLGKIQMGKKANFILYSGEPGQLSSQILFIIDGKNVECNPKQR